MLIVTSLQASPQPLVREAAWFHFVNNRASTHTTAAVTLPYIMNRCEQEKLPYQLISLPGAGYRIRLLDLAEISADALRG